ncbi:MAG: enoyl-CoA hydratase/isomerase family protein [Cumulibacter sp.]
MGDLEVTKDGYVAIFRVQRGPNNFFDNDMIGELAEAGRQADADKDTRAIVLCSEGKNFCAGANFGEGGLGAERAKTSGELYRNAAKLFDIKTPIVAAVQGAAVGGGLGLALVADFRVATPSSRLHANFAKLGFHQGFGLSVTLPRLIGEQKAAEMLLTARAVKGEEALALGLVDRVVDGDPLSGALEFARTIAANAPLAVTSIRETLRGDLAAEVKSVLERELSEQTWQWDTADCAEGVAANLARREANFTAS